VWTGAGRVRLSQHLQQVVHHHQGVQQDDEVSHHLLVGLGGDINHCDTHQTLQEFIYEFEFI